MGILVIGGVAAFLLATGQQSSLGKDLPTAPRVIASEPANDAIIGPGPFTLRAIFDRSMRPRIFSFTTAKV